MNAQTLQYQHGISGFVIEKNIYGLTHDESLTQPTAYGNCLNWVMGHIVRTRIQQAQMLGLQPPYAIEDYNAYDTAPVTDASQAMSWNTLVEQFRALQSQVDEGLGKLTTEQMAARAPFSPTNNPDETIGSLLAGLSYHEAYHAGQLGLLRRVVGKKGAIGSPVPEEVASS